MNVVLSNGRCCEWKFYHLEPFRMRFTVDWNWSELPQHTSHNLTSTAATTVQPANALPEHRKYGDATVKIYQCPLFSMLCQSRWDLNHKTLKLHINHIFNWISVILHWHWHWIVIWQFWFNFIVSLLVLLTNAAKRCKICFNQIEMHRTMKQISKNGWETNESANQQTSQPTDRLNDQPLIVFRTQITTDVSLRLFVWLCVCMCVCGQWWIYALWPKISLFQTNLNRCGLIFIHNKSCPCENRSLSDASPIAKWHIDGDIVVRIYWNSLNDFPKTMPKTATKECFERRISLNLPLPLPK